MHLTPQLIPGPQDQWRHLEKNIILELWSTHTQNPRGSDFFLPLPDIFLLGAKVLDMIPVKTENSSHGHGSLMYSICHFVFEILGSVLVSLVSQEPPLLRMELGIFPCGWRVSGLMSWSSFLSLPSLLFSVLLARGCISCFPIFLLTFIKNTIAVVS